MQDIAQTVQQLAVSIPAFLFGIICHEVAHGYAASRLGDPTAKQAGRITLNPIPHIDAMGALVFLITALTTNFVFGWAKPVPIDPRNFRDPRRDMMLSAAAGPATNFLLALIFAVGLRVILLLGGSIPGVQESAVLYPLWLICANGVFINLTLAFLNLTPIPPLDGSHIAMGLLPRRLAMQYAQLERYGFVILIVLLVTGALWAVLGPLVHGGADVILGLVGLA